MRSLRVILAPRFFQPTMVPAKRGKSDKAKSNKSNKRGKGKKKPVKNMFEG